MSSENKEIWKKIEDYDYIVSNFGRIKNLKNNNLLKPQDNRNGYLKVCLSKLSRCCKGLQKTYAGFTWKYI